MADKSLARRRGIAASIRHQESAIRCDVWTGREYDGREESQSQCEGCNGRNYLDVSAEHKNKTEDNKDILLNFNGNGRAASI